MPRCVFADPSLPASVLTGHRGWERQADAGAGNAAQGFVGGGVPVTGKTGERRDNQGLWGALRLACWPVIAWLPPSRWPGSEEGGASGEISLPWREAQFLQRSLGTFLINVITTISRSGGDRVLVLCSQLSLHTQPRGLESPGGACGAGALALSYRCAP